MMTSAAITYNVGGYLPDHSNGNVIEQTVDNGDGTGVRTTYLPDGTVDTVEQLTDLPIPEPPAPDPVAVLEAEVAELRAALTALLGGAP
jgi:hypothetical protein